MKKEKIIIDNYVGGEKLKLSNEEKYKIPFIFSESFYEVKFASFWTKQAAIENSQEVQKELRNLSFSKIVEVVKKIPDYFLIDRKEIEIIAHSTGTPITFLEEAVKKTNDWMRNCELFLDNVFGKINDSILDKKGHSTLYVNSSPIFAVLPSNSEEEVAFVLVQAILSRNSIIVRPSLSGAGSYVCEKFILALNKAIDSLKDSEILILKKAISLLNIPKETNYLETFSIKNWNYIFFGNEKTIEDLKTIVRKKVEPRKFVCYGTGLSMSIVFSDSEIMDTSKKIINSATVNKGNLCESTDIVYVHKEKSKEFIENLRIEAKKNLSIDLLHQNTIGILRKENIEYIIYEFHKKGKKHLLETTGSGSSLKLHTSVVEHHKYEKTQEYPGPIVAVRTFETIDELKDLVFSDLKYNNKKRNLVTSVYSSSEKNFKDTLMFLKSHTVKFNKPTHEMDFLLPHQGLFLIEELVDKIEIIQ